MQELKLTQLKHYLFRPLTSSSVRRKIPTSPTHQRFITHAESSVSENQDNMEKKPEPQVKTGDVMSKSFGEGYSTRSEEEGYGGIYSDDNHTDKVHVNHPDFDRSQGSEVKQQEKGRHQAHEDSS